MLRIFSFALLITACLADTCKPCNPQGSTGTNPPAVGQDLKSLYIDLLGSVKNIHFRKRWADSIQARAAFCCRETLDCVKVNNLNVPICYDKFTTNYAFADGSWGSLTTGEYNAKDGSKANLFTGEYTKAGGEKGNVYASEPAAKPNTATLSIPPQWTGTGVGSAIPATELASIITAATTSPVTSAATTGASATGAQNVAPPSTSSRGGAANVQVDSTRSLSVSLFSAILYLLYAF